MVKDSWNGFNILHTAAGRVGALDVCALPGEGGKNTRGILAAAKKGELDVLFLGGADEINTNELASTFVVYMGTHGDAGAHRADVILPSAAYTEKSVTYVNTEGRAQMTTRAAFPPGEAREDWAILRALSEALGVTQGWNSLEELRQAMYAIAPQLAALISFSRRCSSPFGTGPRRGQDLIGGLCLAGQGFLHDQPHRPRLAHHGGMFGGEERPQIAGGGVEHE